MHGHYKITLLKNMPSVDNKKIEFKLKFSPSEREESHHLALQNYCSSS